MPQKRAASPLSPSLRESGFLLGVLRECMDRGHLPKAALHDMVEIQEDLIQQVVRLSRQITPQAAADSTRSQLQTAVSSDGSSADPQFLPG